MNNLRFDIVTIFPDMFVSPLSDSILKRAEVQRLIEFHFHNPRDFTKDRHRSVDDAPYGGGAGMVMRPEPLVEAIEAIPKREKHLVLFLTPSGERFTQRRAHEFSASQQLILVCGRYEGIDDRVRELVIDREIAVGDAVVSGGEVPAMMVIEAVSRLLPGVLGNEASLKSESFEEGSPIQGLLEYPQFTRPSEYRGLKVPDVLLSGNHADIEAWRKGEARKRTEAHRPDLLSIDKVEGKD